MDVICSEVRFVEISSPNECDKILKIPNEQTEPTDYMANCSKDNLQINVVFRLQFCKSFFSQKGHMPLALRSACSFTFFIHYLGLSK